MPLSGVRRLLHKVHLPSPGDHGRGHRLALQNRAAARNVPLTVNALDGFVRSIVPARGTERLMEDLILNEELLKCRVSISVVIFLLYSERQITRPL